MRCFGQHTPRHTLNPLWACVLTPLSLTQLLRRVTSVDRRQYYEIAPQPEANDDLLTICFAGRGVRLNTTPAVP